MYSLFPEALNNQEIDEVQVKVLVPQLCLTLATPWTVALQASLAMGFSRQEYWSGLPFPSPGHLPNPRIEPRFPALQADSLPAESPRKPRVQDIVLFPYSASF